MKIKQVMFAALPVAAVLACGLWSGWSTSAGQFAGEYFSGVEELWNSGGSSASKTEGRENKTEAKRPDAPEAFTVSGDGEYSFETVEGAAQYYIYLCDTDATDDNDDYLYACQIEADGTAATMTGTFPFDFKYGKYLAKLFAVSEDNTFSKATVIDYVHSGEIAVPRVAYSWDGAGTVTFNVVNVPAYEYTVCPDVEIMVKDLADGTQQTILMEDIAESAYLTAELEAGEYEITAKGVTDSEYVTNQTTDSYTAAESVALTGDPVQTSDYETRATYTAAAMFLIDFTASIDSGASDIPFTWANVLTVQFNREPDREDEWTRYFLVGEGTGTDGLYTEISFKADGTCRMIATGGPYGGQMGGERVAETGPDGCEWVEATGTWTVDEEGIITFTVQ